MSNALNKNRVGYAVSPDWKAYRKFDNADEDNLTLRSNRRASTDKWIKLEKVERYKFSDNRDISLTINLLRSSLKGEEINKGTQESQIYNHLIHTLSGIPQILKSRIIYSSGMFYVALYLDKNLKITFSRYCDSVDLYVTFLFEGEIIREARMTVESLVIAIQKIFQRI